jgi:hypothetical protein
VLAPFAVTSPLTVAPSLPLPNFIRSFTFCAAGAGVALGAGVGLAAVPESLAALVFAVAVFVLPAFFDNKEHPPVTDAAATKNNIAFNLDIYAFTSSAFNISSCVLTEPS